MAGWCFVFNCLYSLLFIFWRDMFHQAIGHSIIIALLYSTEHYDNTEQRELLIRFLLSLADFTHSNWPGAWTRVTSLKSALLTATTNYRINYFWPSPLIKLMKFGMEIMFNYFVQILHYQPTSCFYSIIEYIQRLQSPEYRIIGEFQQSN